MFWSICWRINIKLIFFANLSKMGTHLYLSLLVVVYLDKKGLRSIASVFVLVGQPFSEFRADSHARRLLFPSFLLALIILIQYGGQQIVFRVCTFPPPQQDLFEKTVSSITFLECPRVFYMFFGKDKYCIFFIEPKYFRPDKHHLLDISWLVKQ